MKIIVLHDRYTNEPVIMRVDAILSFKKEVNKAENSEEEYSNINVLGTFYDVKEHIDVVMKKINNAERSIEPWCLKLNQGEKHSN